MLRTLFRKKWLVNTQKHAGFGFSGIKMPKVSGKSLSLVIKLAKVQQPADFPQEKSSSHKFPLWGHVLVPSTASTARVSFFSGFMLFWLKCALLCFSPSSAPLPLVVCYMTVGTCIVSWGLISFLYRRSVHFVQSYCAFLVTLLYIRAVFVPFVRLL